ncbi:MAG: hypothetical protein H0W14_02165 [Actinobacteria bacterium]|nr:hypothetical protein [Actinomycetota bacterium]
MGELDGLWDVERVSGFLPPLLGVRKRIRGPHGATSVGRFPGVPFDVVGAELRYRGVLTGFVDVLTSEPPGWSGRALFRGREYARFRLTSTGRGFLSATRD